MYVCVSTTIAFFSYFGEAKMDMKWRNIGPNHRQNKTTKGTVTYIFILRNEISMLKLKFKR